MANTILFGGGARIRRRYTSLLSILGLICLGFATGCAKTVVTNQDRYEGGKIPRPGAIIVYDFATHPSEIPLFGQSANDYGAADDDMTPEERAEARELGALVAQELVDDLNDMGMNAVRAEGRQPVLNDLVLIGYFSTIDEGSAAKRVLVGFGKGAASVGVHGDGYRMTETGLVRLGGGDVNSGGGQAPGMVLPALVTVATANPVGLIVQGAAKGVGEATGKSGAKGSAERIADQISEVLKPRFEEQGWI